MVFWSAVCGWLGLAFAAEAMGLFAHEFNAAAAIVFLILSAVCSGSEREPGAPTDRYHVLAGRMASLIGLLLVPSHWTIRLFGPALWFWGLDTAARGRGRDRQPAAAFAVGAFVLGLYQYLYGNSLLSWHVVQDLSAWFSSAGEGFVAGFSLGPTFSGIGMLVLAVGVLVGGAVLSARSRVLWLIATAVSVLVIYVSYLAVFAATQPDPEAPLRGELLWWQKIQHAINPVYMPAVLTCALAIPMALYLWITSKRAVAPSRGRVLPAFAPAAMAVLGVALLINAPSGTRPGKSGDGRLQVALYQEGFHNWLTPSKDRYGSRSGGMFGNLPVLVRSMGWGAELIPAITAEALAKKDILFIANPKDSLPDETIDLVDRFVREGGSLLVLGDHTWRKDGDPSMILDEPIEPTHIRFRFDSAYYFIGGWLHSMQYWPHPTTVDLRDETNESGCVVGASLDVEYPATPLVIGRYGYADRGHEEKNPRTGYMDNGMADPGETLGDLVLVAAENVGKGRVVVVGDTSGFVNAIQTQTWPFTSRVFRWLGSSGKASIPWWRDALGALLLVGAGVTVLAMSRTGSTALPLACAVLFLAGWGSRSIVQSKAKPEPLRGDIVLVDLSHVGLHSLEAWRDDAISGVYLNFMREGYFAIGSMDFDAEQVRASDVFVTVTPTAPYSSSELDALEEFMRNGGSVLLLAGWEERAGAMTLLDRFHLHIPHRPQGRAADLIAGTTIMPNYWEAWPVLSKDPTGEPVETVATLRGDPIMIRKRVGRGQLVVIGDGGFMSCRNLETEDSAITANIQFFSWFVQNVLKGETT